jgi:hypothetical protein
VWNGNISVWPQELTETTLIQEVVVNWGGQSSSFYIVSSGSGINPTRGDGDFGLVTPTPTPTTGFTEVDDNERDDLGIVPNG